MLLGGLQKIVTPLEAKAMILTLDKSDQVEKQLQAQRETVHGGHCGKDGKRPPATQSRDPEQPEKQQHGGGAKPPWDPRNKSKGRTWTRGNEYGSRNKREETIRQYSLDRKEWLPSTGVSGSTAKRSADNNDEKTVEQYHNESMDRAREVGVYHPECWALDYRHLVGDKRYFVSYRDLSARVKQKQKHIVRGYSGSSISVGAGAINLCVDVGGVYVKLRLENVFYPPQHQNLLSQAEAHGQGFDVAYNNAKRRYSLLKKGTVALQADMHRCGLRMFTDLLSR
ncbi:hypothetical protein PC119_g11655 [Phytophthora cactorum]|uniref:Uncharacterized protein n=2 Tax=Phytophthora cactorum TaxID=29920 RepID=A0A8T1D8V8_9STRA|nr:hypothetical protein PC114_g11650 [Phytophthora cactorum]KAG2937186.1 hypothetical protein PC117_g11809 [Phytophthora cactorum]KAG3015743.1 hypothetical protein PC119_g11655 [Phytophthora cactorum]